jgi:mannose-6-phosphate isomerase-like protein (cupin superfamily)
MADQPQIFRYEQPDSQREKSIVPLCRTDILRADVQVVREGGENNLHSHTGNDGFWMVLAGRVRFYGEGDALLAELGRHEGIAIPRGFKYWFESASPEPLELLHVVAQAQTVKDERINYTPLKSWQAQLGVGGRPGHA